LNAFVNTAQNVNLEYNTANLGARIGAYCLDSLIKFSYILIISMLGSLMGMFDSGYFFLGILYLPLMFYTLLFEILNNGQTPGKKSMDIQVVSADGAPTTFGQYFIRWLLGMVDFYIGMGMPALIAIGSSLKSQRLGDMAANTLVISIKKETRIEETAFHKLNEDYIPGYPTVANLSTKDIEVIKEVLRNKSDNSFQLLKQTSEKIESILQVERKESSRVFLQKVVMDFNHYQGL